jgi:predicted PurR-regulated permease PerM
MEFDRTKITLAFLGILVLVAVGVVLKFAGPVLLPLIIAWLLSYLIGPAVNFMTPGGFCHPHSVARRFLFIRYVFVFPLFCFCGSIS